MKGNMTQTTAAASPDSQPSPGSEKAGAAVKTTYRVAVIAEVPNLSVLHQFEEMVMGFDEPAADMRVQFKASGPFLRPSTTSPASQF
jgi:hypothetical protein